MYSFKLTNHHSLNRSTGLAPPTSSSLLSSPPPSLSSSFIANVSQLSEDEKNSKLRLLPTMGSVFSSKGGMGFGLLNHMTLPFSPPPSVPLHNNNHDNYSDEIENTEDDITKEGSEATEKKKRKKKKKTVAVTAPQSSASPTNDSDLPSQSTLAKEKKEKKKSLAAQNAALLSELPNKELIINGGELRSLYTESIHSLLNDLAAALGPNGSHQSIVKELTKKYGNESSTGTKQFLLKAIKKSKSTSENGEGEKKEITEQP